MTDLPTPAVPDLARAAGSTVDELFDWFLLYYNHDPIPWNYRCGTRCVKAAYKGLRSLEQLMAGCDSEKVPQGKTSNREVVEFAAPIAFGRNTQVFDLPRRQFPFGRDRFAGYRIPFFFVENEVVKLYFLQPRKGAALNRTQLGMVATVYKRYLLDTEFYGLKSDVEFIDLSADPQTKLRNKSVYSLNDLEIWPEDELQSRLSLITEALDRVQGSGLVKPRRRYIKPDADMPLFD